MNSCQIADVSYRVEATYKHGIFSKRTGVSIVIGIGTKSHNNTGLKKIAYEKSKLVDYYKFPLYDLKSTEDWFQNRAKLISTPYYPFFLLNFAWNKFEIIRDNTINKKILNSSLLI